MKTVRARSSEESKTRFRIISGFSKTSLNYRTHLLPMGRTNSWWTGVISHRLIKTHKFKQNRVSPISIRLWLALTKISLKEARAAERYSTVTRARGVWSSTTLLDQPKNNDNKLPKLKRLYLWTLPLKTTRPVIQIRTSSSLWPGADWARVHRRTRRTWLEAFALSPVQAQNKSKTASIVSSLARTSMTHYKRQVTSKLSRHRIGRWTSIGSQRLKRTMWTTKLKRYSNPTHALSRTRRLEQPHCSTTCEPSTAIPTRWGSCHKPIGLILATR